MDSLWQPHYYLLNLFWHLLFHHFLRKSALSLNLLYCSVPFVYENSISQFLLKPCTLSYFFLYFLWREYSSFFKNLFSVI